MNHTQPGILAEETKLARYLVFSIDVRDQVETALRKLAEHIDTQDMVIGFGESVTTLIGKPIAGLRTFSAFAGNGIEFPSTPGAVWCWIRGNDRGKIFHRSRELVELLSPAFILNDSTDAFQFDANRDLTGFEDGTENPKGDDALDAAVVQNQGAGLDGGSFVAVHHWLHDFETFNSMTTNERDNVMGRHISNNEEFDEAPESAHVKRTAQESFEPQAFILRRSMPWVDELEGGLVFVAFGKSFDAFEAILNRMLGNEDGIVDALFTISKPISGAYYWCPPIKDAKLDLRAILD